MAYYGASTNVDPYDQGSYLGGNYQQQQIGARPESSGMNGMASAVGSGAVTGGATGGPAGAAVGAAVGFLSQYMAQKAQDERSKRDRAAQIAGNLGQNESQAYGNLMNSYRGALR